MCINKKIIWREVRKSFSPPPSLFVHDGFIRLPINDPVFPPPPFLHSRSPQEKKSPSNKHHSFESEAKSGSGKCILNNAEPETFHSMTRFLSPEIAYSLFHIFLNFSFCWCLALAFVAFSFLFTFSFIVVWYSHTLT